MVMQMGHSSLCPICISREVVARQPPYDTWNRLYYIAASGLCYGLFTVIVVPLLSPSRSSFAVASYVASVLVKLLTLKLTLLVVLLTRALVIEHLPVLSVVHETVLVE